MKETRFKQTEIGLIPEDWGVSKLGEKCLIYRGGSPRPIENYITNNADGINWIKIGDVESDSKYIIKTKEKIKQEGVIRSRAVYAGDLILSNSMSFGRPYILKINGCIHDGWLVIQEYIKNIDLDYLYYLLGSAYVFRQYTQMAAGSSVQNLNKEKVANVIVAIPTKKEQNKIATVLISIDNLLLSLDKLIEKKRLIKQGVMQELLTGKKRLPGFTGEWVERRLGEISKIYRGGSPRPIENYLTTMNDGINWIKIGDVDKSAKYIYKTQERIKPSGVSSSRYVKSGDFLLSNSMSFGRPYILKTSGCIHDGWLVIQDYQQYCDCDFLYYTLSSNYILQQYKAKAAGSSVLNLNKDIASNVIMKYPKDILEQKAIAKVLSSIDKEIESLEGKKAKYEQIKQGMMQLLLTGKIRLIS